MKEKVLAAVLVIMYFVVVSFLSGIAGKFGGFVGDKIGDIFVKILLVITKKKAKTQKD